MHAFFFRNLSAPLLWHAFAANNRASAMVQPLFWLLASCSVVTACGAADNRAASMIEAFCLLAAGYRR